MFRALNHEGVAAISLFHLFTGGRRMTTEQTLQAMTASAVLANSLEALRALSGVVRGFLGSK